MAGEFHGEGYAMCMATVTVAMESLDNHPSNLASGTPSAAKHVCHCLGPHGDPTDPAQDSWILQGKFQG